MSIDLMIVDDSGAVRHALEQLIGPESDINIQASVPDPFLAAKEIQKKIPDVIILDLEMPKMDGITFLKKIMSQKPIPTIICSTLTAEGSPKFLEALRAGAVEVVEKPKMSTKKAFEESQMDLLRKIRMAATSNVGTKKRSASVETKKKSAEIENTVKYLPDEILPRRKYREQEGLERVVAIGASTGGTVALEQVLSQLPLTVPGIVIVQHMPEHFTAAFAKRLNSVCKINVVEAKGREKIMPGCAYIAPGNIHMAVRRVGTGYILDLLDGPPITRHKPSVDILFRSVAGAAGPNALGVIMTGMGDDGARCLLEMQEEGAKTIAQDEKSCVVYGMPREAVRLGAAGEIIPLSKIPQKITSFFEK